jgi:nitrile hydratase accessory protein
VTDSPPSCADRLAPTATRPGHSEAVFAEPWEARAFALALTLSGTGRFSWDEFRDRLIAEIARADAAATREGRAMAANSPHGPYYECWLAALEQILREKALLNADEIEARAAAIAASPPAPTKAQSRGPVRIA